MLHEKLNKYSIFRKHPHWGFVFSEWITKHSKLDIQSIESSFLLFLKHKNLLKNDITLEFAKNLIDHNDNTNRSIVEKFNDNIHSFIHINQKSLFIKSLKTSKYNHLFDQLVENEIHSIIDNKISISCLKKQFFKKLSFYKSSTTLLSALIDFKNKNICWNKESYLNIVETKKLEVKVLNEQSGYFFIEVNDYKSCKELGSSSWCIVYDENDFNAYSKDLNRQLIGFNFDLPIEDNNSIIGVTISCNGKILDSYNKDDSPTDFSILSEFKFLPLEDDIILNYFDGYSDDVKFLLSCKEGLLRHAKSFVSDGGVRELDFDNDAIQLASEHGHLDVVEWLLSFPEVNPSVSSNHAIQAAAEFGYTEIVKVLINDTRVDPSANDDFSIGAASENGFYDIVEILLNDTRVDPSSCDNYAVRFAIMNGHLSTVKLLLRDQRVDPSANNNEAICFISSYSSIDVFKILLADKRVDPSARNNSPLRWAVGVGNYDITSLFLNDSRVNTSFDNNYALKNACVCKYESIVTLLTTKELNINKDWLIDNLTLDQIEFYYKCRTI